MNKLLSRLHKFSFKRSLLLASVLFLCLMFCFTPKAKAATYYSSGTITSVNLLSGLGVKTINKFGYNVSSLPAGTGIKVRFSQDSIAWTSWNVLSSGNYTAESDAIDISGLNWKGGNFYYQTEFDTSDTSTTPILDDIVVYYSPGVYITTQTASVVYPAGATANGTIVGITDGNATIRGFKYGLTQADTWDVHENGSFNVGAYALNITGLSPSITYYVRSYATNPDGTSYGDYTSFTTGTYASSGNITSTNLLLGQTVTTIDEFDYTLSAKPEGTSATIQFSQNGTTWYNSSATLNGTDILITGANPINLSKLAWTGANFYYKIALTANSTGSSTPVLDDINVVINSATPVTVAKYRFDEGYGSVANNAGTGGSALNGTITNGIWNTNGKYDKALQFNGTSSYVAISTPITGIRTISFWVKPTSTTTNLINFDGGTHTITASNGVVTANGFIAPVIYVNAVRGAALSANTWQHILITTTYADAFSSTTITLGEVGVNYFTGLMDQVKIFNYSMNPTQVKVDFNQGEASSLGAIDTTQGNPPIAYYNFDEGAGTTANDISGNGNPGVITSTNYVPGKYGKALSFNGSSSFVGVSNTLSVNTVEFWVKPTTNTASMFNLTATQYIAAASGVISATNFSTPTVYVNGVAGSTLTAGVWNYVTVTTATPISANAITIGKANSAYTAGVIDDVRIYNYARTPKQITEDMLGNQPAVGAEGGSNPAVIFYRFDEGQGGTANNSGSGGPALNGSITSGTWNMSGKFGKALTFTASTSVVRALPTDPGTSNALSFWVYPTTSAASKTLVTNLTTDTNSKPVYGNCTGRPLSLNTWTHIVAESDGTGSCKIFQNGIQTASSTTGVTYGTTFNIGSTSFVGSIDEFKFYYYPLTANEVKVAYNQGLALSLGAIDTTQGNPPIADWEFDEGLGQSAYDISGNGYTGTATGTTIVAGKFGKARSFNGSSDLISGTISPYFGDNLTVELWAYTKSTNDSILFSFGNNNGYCIENNRGGSKTWQLRISNVGGTIDSGVATALNQWAHVALSRTNGTWAMYINGIKSSLSSTTDPISGSTSFFIGSSYGLPFTGYLDQVKIYNYARTPAQIAFDYNRGKPMGEWRLDEGLGTTLHDDISATNSATLTGGVWGAGKMSNAIQFNGTSDHADVTKGLNYIQSISFWAKPTTTTQSFLQLNAGQYISSSAGVVSATGFVNPQIYVNGKLSGTLATGNWNLVTVVTATSLSASSIKLGVQNSTYYSGWLDDIQIFNYPLTSNQVKLLYDDNMGVMYGP